MVVAILVDYGFCFTLNKLNTNHTVGTGFGLRSTSSQEIGRSAAAFIRPL